jgi:hypothetical protein
MVAAVTYGGSSSRTVAPGYLPVHCDLCSREDTGAGLDPGRDRSGWWRCPLGPAVVIAGRIVRVLWSVEKDVSVLYIGDRHEPAGVT